MLLLVFILLALFGGAREHSATTRGHTCDAPCTVYFPGAKPQEDEIGWQYRHGRAYVLRVTP